MTWQHGPGNERPKWEARLRPTLSVRPASSRSSRHGQCRGRSCGPDPPAPSPFPVLLHWLGGGPEASRHLLGLYPSRLPGTSLWQEWRALPGLVFSTGVLVRGVAGR